MRLSFLIMSISIAVGLVHAAKEQQQVADVRPVSYSGSRKRSTLKKRDYATTLQYLRAAMANYRKDAVTPPSAEFVQLEQSLPPAPPLVQQVQAAQPPPPPSPPPAVDPVWAVETEPMPPAAQQVISPPPVSEQPDIQPLDVAEPPVPDLDTPSSSSTTTTPPVPEEEPPATAPEPGSEGTTDTVAPPIHADIEEDDTFDPEEDPDDVDDPPIVNGVPVDREE